MTPLEQKIIDKYEKEFVIKSNAGTGLLRYTDADKLKQFLIKSIKEVEEETRKEVVEECKQKMAQSNEWWNKKLLSITNKEIKK